MPESASACALAAYSRASGRGIRPTPQGCFSSSQQAASASPATSSAASARSVVLNRSPDAPAPRPPRARRVRSRSIAAVGPMTISSSPAARRVSAAGMTRAGGPPGRGRLISMTRTPSAAAGEHSARVRPASASAAPATERSEKSGGSSTRGRAPSLVARHEGRRAPPAGRAPPGRRPPAGRAWRARRGTARSSAQHRQALEVAARERLGGAMQPVGRCRAWS